MSRAATGFGRFSRWLTNRRAVTIALVAAIGVHTLALPTPRLRLLPCQLAKVRAVHLTASQAVPSNGSPQQRLLTESIPASLFYAT